MSEQPVDLRSTLSILRRNRRRMLVAAAVGAAAGLCSVLLWPPMYTSSSLVLLPPAQDATGQAVERDVGTEIEIVSSDVVLRPAGAALTPRMSARTLARHLKVTAPSSDVLEIETKAETPDLAEDMARSVAKSEATYISEAATSLSSVQQVALRKREKDLRTSLAQVNEEIEATAARREQAIPGTPSARDESTALAQLTAQQASLVLQLDYLKDKTSGTQPTAGGSIIQAASPARRPWLVAKYLVYALLGLMAAVAITSVVLVIAGRRDRRLRYRDEIADAVGSAVIASVRSRVPSSVAGWTDLLANYSPGTVDAWAIRQALKQLAGEQTGNGRRQGEAKGRMLHPSSLTMLTLSEDSRGLAMGPQLASHAASAGIDTCLVAALGHYTAAGLWAACYRATGGEEVRPHLLVGDGTHGQDREGGLTVVLAVVDRNRPELGDLPETTVTVLAVSPGSATAEDLARVAVTADEAGRSIDGIVVADPDNLDRTTGRLLQHERSQQVPLPTRLTGTTASQTADRAGRSRSGNVSGLHRRPG